MSKIDMQNLEEIKQRLDEMLTKRNEQLVDLKTRIGEALQAQAKASAEMEAATETANQSKYKKAADESRYALDYVAMLEGKRRKLRDPLVDEAEFKSIAGEITQILDRVNRDNKKKAAEYAQGLLDIKADTAEAIAFGNALLQMLQVDIFQQQSTLIKGQPLHHTERLQYKNYDLLQIIRRMESDINWLKGGSKQ